MPQRRGDDAAAVEAARVQWRREGGETVRVQRQHCLGRVAHTTVP